MYALDLVRQNRTALERNRSEALDRMEAVARRALDESRQMTTTEADEVDDLRRHVEGLDDQLSAIDTREAELVDHAERHALAAARPSLAATRYFESPWDRPATNEVRSRAVDAITRANAVPDDSRGRLVDAIDAGDGESDLLARWALATSDPAYTRAFAKLAVDPTTAVVRMTDEEAASFQRANEVQRAMSLTDSAGGYLVPFELDPAVLLTGNGTEDPMRDVARVVTIASDVWHGVSSAGITASWDAEASEVSDDTPTLAQPSVTPHRLTAFVPFSIEVGQDATGFADEIRELFRDAFATAEGTGFWTGAGDGSNQPYGLITRLDATTASEVAATTTDTFGIPDLYKLSEALPARFRKRAVWAANHQVINKIRRFGEGTTGSNSAFWTDLEGGKPPLLLGRPIVEASSMDTFDASTTTENTLVIFDASRYVVVDRVGTTVELVPHLFSTANGRPTGQRGFFAYKRTGGDLVTPEAGRLLQT